MTSRIKSVEKIFNNWNFVDLSYNNRDALTQAIKEAQRQAIKATLEYAEDYASDIGFALDLVHLKDSEKLKVN